MTGGLGIIFHSGSCDRVNHGLSIAIGALAMGYDVKMFFTHFSLFHLSEDGDRDIRFSESDEFYEERFRKFIENGNIHTIRTLIQDCKRLGGHIYVCPASMALLNISREELIPEVDGSMGITAFLSETEGYRLIFI